MITTHLVFFMKKFSNAAPATGFKGYTTVPTVLAFMRKISNAGVVPPVEEAGSMLPQYRRKRR